MAADIPKDPKDLAQEDKDALDLLASEAKEFEKASTINPPSEPSYRTRPAEAHLSARPPTDIHRAMFMTESLTLYSPLGCRDRPYPQGVPA